jgi:cation diffusion facilitator family transporter
VRAGSRFLGGVVPSVSVTAEPDTSEADFSSTETGSESTTTVLVAGAANLVIAIAKFAGAAVSGSAAMFSEAVHSVADTITEVLLLIAVRRGDKGPDREHPFGHGREFYFWALLASMFTFVAGAGVSILQGIQKIASGEHEGDPLISYIVLAVAFLTEGTSLIRALMQVKASADRWRVRPERFLSLTTDTAVKAVTFEDSAALVGLVLAGAGLALTEATGSAVWDGLASILIGCLLVVVAVALARSNMKLLVGQAGPPGLELSLRRELESLDVVEAVPTFVTTVLGPEKLLVAARVTFAPTASAEQIAEVADEAERRFKERHPGVQQVFIDPTPAPEGGGDR